MPRPREHGTPEGYEAGCTNDRDCPAFAVHGMSCQTAYYRHATGERRYGLLRARGFTSTQIARRLGFAPARPAAAVIDLDPLPIREQHAYAHVTPPKPDTTPTPKETPAMTTPTPPAPKPAPRTTEPKKPATRPDKPKRTTEAPKPARTAKRTAPTPAPGSGRTAAELREIRAWAWQNDLMVASHGRIPQRIIDAYDEAAALTPETPAIAPDAAQPLAEGANDSEPQEDAGDPAIETEAPVDVPEAEDEAMGHPTGNEYTDVLDEARDRANDVDPASSADTLQTEPEVGMRAWVRFDDGVAVVREVLNDQVRVSYLPDPRDEETWESIDWLDTVTELLPKDDFAYDRFGTDDMARDLEQWQLEGRTWSTWAGRTAAARAALEDETPTHELGEPVDDETSTGSDTTEPEPDTETPGWDIEHPEWASVTIPRDIARLRETVAQLEEELAEAHRHRDEAQRSMILALRQWADGRAQLEEERRVAAAQLRYANLQRDAAERSAEQARRANYAIATMRRASVSADRRWTRRGR